MKPDRNLSASCDPWPGHVCTVCGEPKLAGQVWFLLAESPWEDRVRILQWQEVLAAREGIHPACCPAHVQELVTYWMTVGTLDYPFANIGSRVGPLVTPRFPPVLQEPDTQGIRQVGEIAIHRESLGRVLEQNPDCLQIILDELVDVLERETAGNLARFESAMRLSSGYLRQM